MKQNSLLYILLFALGFGLYFNSLNHNYVLDDFSVIKENFIVKKGFYGIPTIWKTHYRYGYGFQQASLYRPLTLTLFAIQWEIAPDDPHFAHFFNVLLYALLGIIIYVFLVKLLGKEQRFIAFITSALFIAHPIHTEVVANIKSVDDILVMLFSLSAIILLLQYLENKNKKFLIGSVLLIQTAFLCKESTVSFLLIIPFTLYLFRQLKFSRIFKLTSLYLIPLVVYLLFRFKVLGTFSGNKDVSKLDNILLATSEGSIQLATSLKILGLYLWKLVFPHPLVNDYSFNQIELVNFGNIYVWISVILYAVMIYFAFQQRKKRPVVSFAIGFFLFSIFLYSNLLFKIGTSFGERLLFIPSLGFCLLIAYLIRLPFKKKINPDKIFKTAGTPLALVALLVIIYSFKTVSRSYDWSDNYTLYATDVENCSNSARCNYYYGLELMKEKALHAKNDQEKGRFLLQALNAFNQAIRIFPEYSDAWAQKGLTYYRLNNFAEAEKAYYKATLYNPGNAAALSNLGSMYFQQQKYREAKTVYEKALQANPNHIDALANYASTLGVLGEYQNAITYFKKAIALNPNEASYYQMVGATYQNLGNQQLANQYLLKAQQLR